MSSSPDSPNAHDPSVLGEQPVDRSEAVTATDLIITPPEYLREIHDALERAERAYARGDVEDAMRCAEEGQAVIRVALPKLGPTAIPWFYDAFFQSFRIQPQYRRAVVLYKQALLCRERQAGRRAVGRPCSDDGFRKAWQILEPAVAELPATPDPELLVYDYPIAGRVLRGVVRLRDKLRRRVGHVSPPR